MKAPAALACCATALAGLFARGPSEPQAVVIFTGDILGYLAPCGCSKPQVGGIRRLAGVVRALLSTPNSHYVDIGNWTRAQSRQDELKAEMLAAVFASLNASYLNVGPMDAQLGEGYVKALDQIAGGRMGTASAPSVPVEQGGRRAGPLWLLGLAPPASADLHPETPPGLTPVVLAAAGDAVASRWVDEMEGALVIYSQHGDPPIRPTLREGNTFVSPGDRARYVGKIELVDGQWQNLTLIELGPEKLDDPVATSRYNTYLDRVARENLLASMPRLRAPLQYVGSEKCSTCHGKVYRAWKKTMHAQAYGTLQREKHAKDPECVGCHVVGLRYETGFRSLAATPALANVGCEACHGPASGHMKKYKAPYGKAGEASCKTCHDIDNSPTFDFKSYWAKIRH